MKKRLIARLIPAVVTAAIMFSGTPPVHADTTQEDAVTACFNDVHPNNFFYSPVYWAKANGITSGTSGSTYSPDQPCTRGQMVTFLWRMKGSPAPEQTDYFGDVSQSSVFRTAIAWAKENGITAGTSPATFSPDQPCTRGQMAAFLWRYNGSPAPADTDSFSDVSGTSVFAPAIAWAKGQGITSGTTDTTYSPDAPCTRGQMATFLYRMNGSPKVTVNTPTPSPSPTPSLSPSTDPSNEGKEQPGKGPRVEGNTNYGHWVRCTDTYYCNGCGEYFWGLDDYSYSDWLGNGIHYHGSQAGGLTHDFWVWDDVPKIEEPNSGKPFYSEAEWNNYLKFWDAMDKIREQYNLPQYPEQIAHEKQVRSMSWEKDAIAPTK